MDYPAYIPCYDVGNAVMAVKVDGGTEIISKGIKSLMSRLLRENGLDIRYVRENYSVCLGRKGKDRKSVV